LRICTRGEARLPALVRALAAEHAFVPYAEAVRRIVAGDIDRPVLAVTVDDGLRSALAVARVLAAHGVRACFFVCPGLVGARGARLDAARAVLGAPEAELLDWDDLERLRADGHEVGSHTTTHADLARVSPARWRDEIAGSADLLRARLGEVAHFAWPYGRWRHVRHAAVVEVFAAGYASCASAERGCHVTAPAGPHALCLRRDHVMPEWPVSHVRYFLARSSRHAGAGTNWPW
jgi:peptidoglycan/xylan/chitin deacetylase (PgdA/CDA1 family)